MHVFDFKTTSDSSRLLWYGKLARFWSAIVLFNVKCACMSEKRIASFSTNKQMMASKGKYWRGIKGKVVSRKFKIQCVFIRKRAKYALTIFTLKRCRRNDRHLKEQTFSLTTATWRPIRNWGIERLQVCSCNYELQSLSKACEKRDAAPNELRLVISSLKEAQDLRLVPLLKELQRKMNLIFFTT